MKNSRRLKYILETLRLFGFVSFEDVQRELPELTKAKSWYVADRKTIAELGLPVRVTDRHFISTEPGTRRRTYALRKGLDSTKKQNLARAATALLAGHQALAPVIKGLHELMDTLIQSRIHGNSKVRRDDDNGDDLLLEVTQIANRLAKASAAARNIREVTESFAARNLERVVANMKRLRNEQAERNVPQLVRHFLAKSHRHVLLDSGTTTEAIATDLKEQHFWTGPPYLTVYTNAPRIEYALEECEISVVGLMGEVRKDTSARTGYWNQRSLELLREIAIDVACVGTTGLALEGSRIVGFACDSSDEAQTKSQMLGISRLRAVCADGSKLERATSSAFVFADADAAAVDILITDYSAVTGAQKHLTTLAKEGILVLIGGDKNDPDRLGYWDPIQQAIVP